LRAEATHEIIANLRDVIGIHDVAASAQGTSIAGTEETVENRNGELKCGPNDEMSCFAVRR
jgi:hypothetical protein